MEERFFHETIESWEDWGRVYQSIPAFEPLAREIYRRERLPFQEPRNLTPGTNAVFRVGDTVVKIFFPKESGLDPFPDFRNESAVCGRLAELSIPTPRVLAEGYLADKYRFYYLVTEYVRGEEAREWLKTASPGQKREFAEKLRELLRRLNQPAEGLIPQLDLLARAVENPRLKKLPPSLAEDMRRRARSLELTERVLVHGDLTGENVLVDGEGNPIVIDCADACLAPSWYEYGPLVFELFQCDPVLPQVFAGKEQEEFVERTLDAVSIHDFGADLLRGTAERAEIPMFSRLEEARKFLLQR